MMIRLPVSRSRSLAILTRRIIPCRRHLETATKDPTSRSNFKVPNHDLDSVPSLADGVGSPAVESSKGKVWSSADEAVKDLKSGMTLLSAGFGLCGVAETLIQAIQKRPELTGLKIVSNNAGIMHTGGLASLIESRQISRLTLSYVGTNKHLERAYLDGDIALELNPQGSIAERLRAAGAGIPGIYTRTGVDTLVETGGIPERLSKDGRGGVATKGEVKSVKVFGDKKYLFEPAIHGDVAILRAWKVDKAGNCIFRYTTRAFAPLMAKAAKLSIVEAENIVEIGEISPMQVDLPGIFIDRIVPATAPKQIEITTLRHSSGESNEDTDPAKRRRMRIARRAAQELKDGYYVNLGVGMPVLAASFLPEGVKVWLQSENGILGMGPYPEESEVDADIINAGKETVTLVPGASVFDSSESFGMIRGGHVDVSILGAMQVAANGDLANFMIPGKLVKGMGGAMDLCSNPDETKIIVVTDHTDKSGRPKIVQDCTLPLTAARVASRIITDRAVFDVDRVHGGGLTLIELAEGETVESIRNDTGAEFKVAKTLAQFK